MLPPSFCHPGFARRMGTENGLRILCYYREEGEGMTKKQRPLFYLVLLLGLWFGSGSALASIDYGDFAGTMVDFGDVKEDSTTDTLPLFGTPTHQPGWDRLLFFPTQFSSCAEGGSADTTSGTLQFTITAKDGYAIDRVFIREFGDYTMTGDGSSQTQANVNGLLTVTPLVGPGDVGTDFSLAEFSMPVDSSGPFALDWEVDFGSYEAPVTQVMVSWNNTLQTSSESGTTSFIQKKVIDGPAIGLSVNDEPVPIPGAILLFTSGLGVFGFWLKRNARARV
jgi:hypothetical protein